MGFPLGWRDWKHRNWKFQERGGVGVAQRGSVSALWSFRGRYGSRRVEHYDLASPPGPSVRLCPGFRSRSAERTLPLRRNSTALLCFEPFVMQTGRLRPGGDGLGAGHVGNGGELGWGPGA